MPVSLSFEHQAGDSTILLGTTPNFRENILDVVRDLPSPSTDLTRGLAARRLFRVAPFREAARGPLATDHVILNHGQVTWTTPELAPPSPNYHTEDVSALDRFNVHRCPTRRVFSGTGLELVTKQATVRYLYHSATAATLQLFTHILDEDYETKREEQRTLVFYTGYKSNINQDTPSNQNPSLDISFHKGPLQISKRNSLLIIPKTSLHILIINSETLLTPEANLKLPLPPKTQEIGYWRKGTAIDHQARRRFVEWAQNEIAVVPDFHKRILFSDEAHFWLNGYDNKQNGRIWSEAHPQEYVETPLYPEKLTVWCALWAGGIIGPYFFKHDEGHNVTVNGDRYRTMITNFFIPELNNHDIQELPPRSCDLTPLDYFLWGYVKSLVYADKPQTLDHLEDNIRRVIADIRPQMLEKVIENWTSRLDYIRASPMPEIIFKM
ncbi:putative DD41D transposase [Trichonephila clavipes]|nr:putative DD41D transposase [Trichonephila clavipes]